MKGTVFVFARAPRLGTVKRRLAAGIGDAAALQFYRATLDRTLRRLARDRRFTTVLAVTPDRARGPFTRGLPTVPQGRGDLGQRMLRALLRARCAAVVGSDIPDMCAEDAAQALHLLGRAAAVFGPAADGGYWLVAFGPRKPANAFRNVRWSSEHALADTLANLAGHDVMFLRTLSDVDDVNDFRRLRASTMP